MVMARKAGGMISLREPYTRKLNGGPSLTKNPRRK